MYSMEPVATLEVPPFCVQRKLEADKRETLFERQAGKQTYICKTKLVVQKLCKSPFDPPPSNNTCSTSGLQLPCTNGY